MRKRLFALVLILTICLFSLFAYVLGGTNFGFSGYPGYKENKPSEPYVSYDGTVSKSQYESYKRSVESYVENAKEYIENGNNDMKRIQEAQKAALDSANNVINEYNSWLGKVKVSSSYY